MVLCAREVDCGRHLGDTRSLTQMPLSRVPMTTSNEPHRRHRSRPTWRQTVLARSLEVVLTRWMNHSMTPEHSRTGWATLR
jgi:hypothetical protein